jgi:hypothetical protein
MRQRMDCLMNQVAASQKTVKVADAAMADAMA